MLLRSTRRMTLFAAFIVVLFVLSSMSVKAKDMPLRSSHEKHPVVVKPFSLQASITLYENLALKVKQVSLLKETQFVKNISVHRLHLVQPSYEVWAFSNPNSPRNVFFITKVTDQYTGLVVYFLNGQQYWTANALQNAIKDQVDWEAIGRALGVYSGSISVPLGS